MKTFVRDSTVRVQVTFHDISGNVVTPLSATVTLSYMVNCERTHTNYALVQDNDNWIYDWDSRVADPGHILGHAQTDGAVPISSVDFEFRLTANKANREEAES